MSVLFPKSTHWILWISLALGIAVAILAIIEDIKKARKIKTLLKDSDDSAREIRKSNDEDMAKIRAESLRIKRSYEDNQKDANKEKI